jgi:hypothetical protein
MLKQHAEEAFANWKDCLNIINHQRTDQFLDVIFWDQDEGCPAFDELFCVVGELKVS